MQEVLLAYEKFADKKEVLHFTNSSRSKITVLFKTQMLLQSFL